MVFHHKEKLCHVMPRRSFQAASRSHSHPACHSWWRCSPQCVQFGRSCSSLVEAVDCHLAAQWVHSFHSWCMLVWTWASRTRSISIPRPKRSVATRMRFWNSLNCLYLQMVQTTEMSTKVLPKWLLRMCEQKNGSDIVVPFYLSMPNVLLQLSLL